jgi:hypothetical protein
MKTAELFPEGGRGIIGTADAKGGVNLAVFATPHVVDEETLAWGFAEGRSYQNLKENPRASYLYLAPSRGCNGWRLSLRLTEMGEGELLERIKGAAEVNSIPSAASQVKHVGIFKIEEVRPLT